jgi:hypothetical protein
MSSAVTSMLRANLHRADSKAPYKRNAREGHGDDVPRQGQGQYVRVNGRVYGVRRANNVPQEPWRTPCPHRTEDDREPEGASKDQDCAQEQRIAGPVQAPQYHPQTNIIRRGVPRSRGACR